MCMCEGAGAGADVEREGGVDITGTVDPDTAMCCQRSRLSQVRVSDKEAATRNKEEKAE